MGFCDLNISLTNAFGERITDLELDNILTELIRLNFTHVCLNTVVRGKLIPNSISPAIPKVALQKSNRIRSYSRITLDIEDVNFNCGLSSNPLIQQFDVVAVCPRSEKALQLACSTLDIDLICIDLSGGRLEYPIKSNIIGEAIGRGVHFEITYSDCLSDSGRRRNLFGNAISLIRASMCKNIVISSAASEALLLRAPKDILHMAFLLGLNGDCPFAAINVNPMKVLERVAARNFTCKSTISSNQAVPSEQQSFLHEDFIKF